MENKWDKLEGQSDFEHNRRMFRQVNLSDVMRRERILPSDPNFKDKVSPYMSGEVDPSIGVHVDLGLREDQKLNYHGYANVPEAHSETFSAGDDGYKTIDHEPNTVAAIHNQNTPFLYGHEYRHHNYPELGESHNRIIDLIAAQTPIDVDESLRGFADDVKTRQEHRDRIPPSKFFGQARHKLRNITSYPENYEDINNVLVNESEATNKDEIKDLIGASKTKQFLNDEEDLERWKIGLGHRNRARKNNKPETIAEELRAAFAKLGME